MENASKRSVKWDRTVLWAGCIAAAGFCIVTAYQDKAAAATVLGVLTGVFLIFIYLPLMDNFAFFGLKAKLRERITEAEELTKLLRASASTSSKLLLYQLGYMNRMSDVPWAAKQNFMREIEDNLSMHEIPESQVREMREPLLRFMTIDLLSIAEQIVAQRVNDRRRMVQQQISEKFRGPIDAADPEYIALSAKLKSYQNPNVNFHELLQSPEARQPRSLLDKLIRETDLPEEDKAKLSDLIAEVGNVAEEIWSAHTLTDGSLEYLSRYPKYDSWRSKYIDIFKDNLP
ncbi:hypothetical protein [Rhizobium sp. CF142]|uniref:hypothetical protein n=1 Tax=Rhizobium sp. CF142 TaxID=1144314 RepID=UPI00026F02DA|nr:hypothetical protein [Rhizobium sp. CF142]EJJ27321.1 hypothetical protein PMI11_04335 [Rhizobium sp. CF142]